MQSSFATIVGAAVFSTTAAAYSNNALADDNCRTINPEYERVCGTIDSKLLQSIDDLGGCFKMTVKAASKWNASGVRLLAGHIYAFTIQKEKYEWKDKSIASTAQGWPKGTIDSMPLWQRPFITASEPFRRAPDHNWFELTGMTAEVGETVFKIMGEPKPLEASGEFCAFANDLPWMYDNNIGSMMLRVTREK